MRYVFAKVVLVAVCVFVRPDPVFAQFWDFADLIERLSGPGPFISVAARLPAWCFSKDTLTKMKLSPAAWADVSFPIKPDETTTQFDSEWLFDCMGLVTKAKNPAAFPHGFRDQQVIIGRQQILAVEATLGGGFSLKNNLPYDDGVQGSDTRVYTLRYGIGARYVVGEAAHAYGGWERQRFSSGGGLFRAFSRDTFRLEFGLRPLWNLKGDEVKWYQSLTAVLGVRTGMGTFRAADFGSSGDYEANDNVQSYFGVGYDFWPRRKAKGMSKP